MSLQNKREVWQRGPLPDIHPLIQPVAFALLQAVEEVEEAMSDFPEEKLWNRPAGNASVGFHLQHLSGVLDRLFTYARGESLNHDQLERLSQEEEFDNNSLTIDELVKRFKGQVDASLVQLRSTPDSILTQGREIGRAKIPTTLISLYIHAAEHTMRHIGQLLVTAKFLKAGI